MEGTLTSGKKFASGTVNVTMNQNRTANTYPYHTDKQSNSMMPRLTVTGLKFKPSYVIIFQSVERTNTPASAGFACILSPMCNYLWQSGYDVTRYLYTDNPNVIGITSNGFTSVFPLNFNSGTYWWIAYE